MIGGSWVLGPDSLGRWRISARYRSKTILHIPFIFHENILRSGVSEQVVQDACSHVEYLWQSEGNHEELIFGLKTLHSAGIIFEIFKKCPLYVPIE